MNFSRKKKPPLEITLTPMIDVVFLLLIFFMVTTTFNQQSSIKINLPEASSDETESSKKRIILTIDAKGVYFISGKDGLSYELLDQEVETLKRALMQSAGGRVRKIPLVISADGQTPHQSVVSALNVASQLGFKRVAFATKNVPEE